jgi:hypothetical protein
MGNFFTTPIHHPDREAAAYLERPPGSRSARLAALCAAMDKAAAAAFERPHYAFELRSDTPTVLASDWWLVNKELLWRMPEGATMSIEGDSGCWRARFVIESQCTCCDVCSAKPVGDDTPLPACPEHPTTARGRDNCSAYCHTKSWRGRRVMDPDNPSMRMRGAVDHATNMREPRAPRRCMRASCRVCGGPERWVQDSHGCARCAAECYCSNHCQRYDHSMHLPILSAG